MSRSRTTVEHYVAGAAGKSSDLGQTIMHVQGANAVGARVFKVSPPPLDIPAFLRMIDAC